MAVRFGIPSLFFFFRWIVSTPSNRPVVLFLFLFDDPDNQRTMSVPPLPFSDLTLPTVLLRCIRHFSFSAEFPRRLLVTFSPFGSSLSGGFSIRCWVRWYLTFRPIRFPCSALPSSKILALFLPPWSPKLTQVFYLWGRNTPPACVLSFFQNDPFPPIHNCLFAVGFFLVLGTVVQNPFEKGSVP